MFRHAETLRVPLYPQGDDPRLAIVLAGDEGTSEKANAPRPRKLGTESLQVKLEITPRAAPAISRRSRQKEGEHVEAAFRGGRKWRGRVASEGRVGEEWRVERKWRGLRGEWRGR